MKKEIKNFRIGHEMGKKSGGKISQYCDLIVGSRSIWKLIRFELIMLLFSNIPGALGLFLRSKFYPLILKKCGKSPVFGSHIVFRHSEKIELGDNVLIDDNCMLDAKGTDNLGIVLKNNVFLGRNSILSSKNGTIILEDGVNIGFNCNIFSGSSVCLGKNTLVAAYCYFIGGDHGVSDLNQTFYDQTSFSSGITVGENCWFGAGAKIQDGITVGANSLIGTSSVVTKDIPEYSVSVGIPAKVIKDRRG